jgi:4-amino-4-deoxy-L-arabinose transferase-like glycosyltransferase
VIAGVTTVLAAQVARELGGGRRAQLIAAACTASSAFALAVGHFVTTTTPDLLSTTLLGWLLVRAARGGSGRPLLAAGVVAGLGIEAKPQVGLVAAVMLAAMLAAGPRSPLRSRWFAGGVAAAVALAAPYVVWQQLHGWPQLTVAGNIAGSAEGGRAGFIPFQLVMVSPLLVPVWVAGLLAPFRRPAWRDLRFVPIGYAALAMLYIAGDGKAYYLASLYPLLLGFGAIPVAAWTLRRRARSIGLTAAVAISAGFSAFVALPLLPARDLPGSVPLAINPDLGETVGWPQFIAAVARAWYRLPAGERRHTAIFTSNYGEAGAIDLLGGARGLPRAYSGHNGFSEWGMPPAADDRTLLVGYGAPAYARPEFTGCRVLAKVDNGIGLNNQEQGLPVMVCRPSAPWPALWPSLRHLD